MVFLFVFTATAKPQTSVAHLPIYTYDITLISLYLSTKYLFFFNLFIIFLKRKWNENYVKKNISNHNQHKQQSMTILRYGNAEAF